LSFQDPYLTSLKLPGIDKLVTSTVGKSTNVLWHDCPIGQFERQELLNQKGCVVWITGLSGSGKSTLACALSRELHSRGHLTYILDGDNLRHGLNRDLCFEAKDRAENIRRVGMFCPFRNPPCSYTISKCVHVQLFRRSSKAVCRCWSDLHC
uniref:APS kinase domain-containing protein n=1 Tax=Aegilops tauschii subsp. strangulata TaxID=200361 RepID=A0A453DY60_AEGTS